MILPSTRCLFLRISVLCITLRLCLAASVVDCEEVVQIISHSANKPPWNTEILHFGPNSPSWPVPYSIPFRTCTLTLRFWPRAQEAYARLPEIADAAKYILLSSPRFEGHMNGGTLRLRSDRRLLIHLHGTHDPFDWSDSESVGSNDA